MKTCQRGYLLVEALVYIGVVVVLLGVAYSAMYRSIDRSIALRRNADDITSALHAGERWRADVRAAANQVRLEDTDAGQLLYLEGPSTTVVYSFATNAISRRVGTGPWVRLLPNAKSSTMSADRREYVTVWRWELELQTRATGSVRPGRIRPLFTFLAVPEQPVSK
jgi:type II secretory pathway pseudopilin PulG